MKTNVIALLLALVCAATPFTTAIAADVTEDQAMTEVTESVADAYTVTADTDVVVIDVGEGDIDIPTADVNAEASADDTADLMAMAQLVTNASVIDNQCTVDFAAESISNLNYIEFEFDLPAGLTVECLDGEMNVVDSPFVAMPEGNMALSLIWANPDEEHYRVSWYRSTADEDNWALIATLRLTAEESVSFTLDPEVNQVIANSRVVSAFATSTSDITIEVVAEPDLPMGFILTTGIDGDIAAVNVGVNSLPRDARELTYTVQYDPEILYLCDYEVNGRLRVATGVVNVTINPQNVGDITLALQFGFLHPGEATVKITNATLDGGELSGIEARFIYGTFVRDAGHSGGYNGINSVSARIALCGEHAEDPVAILGVYDAAGRMIETQIVELTADIQDFASAYYVPVFNLEHTDLSDDTIACKVMVADKNFCPLCPDKTAELAIGSAA